MNERIKELVHKAGLPRVFAETKTIEKFAELIVLECVSMKEELTQFDGKEPFGDGYEQGLKDMADSIKEHFGVDLL